MRKKFFIIVLLAIQSFYSFSQIDAKFSLRDDSQKIMCYTEDQNGLPTKLTTVKFKNTSTCPDGSWFVWNYGDGSQDSIVVSTDKTADGVHEYKKDGKFSVKLFVIDPKNIADSIKNRPILAVEYLSTSQDSVNLIVTYTALDKSQRQAKVRIPSKEFGRKNLAQDIIVYSPIADGSNFSYEIDDPTTETVKGGLESFVYILSVNKENFAPHDESVWMYYWSIYNGSTNVASFAVDSMEYRYTFPKENVKPGYTVSLKIALDSSKFDPTDVEYYALEECVAIQSQNIIVSDYFFSDSTRKEENVDDRETSIPNIFTPNGDGENDVFYFNTNGVDDFSIWIYNNNGTLVYKQTAKTISWTGEDNSGHECNTGTYYYVVKSTNSDKRHNTAGFIQLFR